MTTFPVAPHALVTAGILGLIAWRGYRRVRRLIGRQPVRPWALIAATAFFTIAVVTLAVLNAGRLPMLEALGAGCVVGMALGAVAVKLTRFESCESGSTDVPNPVLGVAVSLLFVGRLAYRLGAIYLSTGSLDATAMRSFGSSALTLACFALVAGYYAAFSAGVLWRFRATRSVRAMTTDVAGAPLA